MPQGGVLRLKLVVRAAVPGNCDLTSKIELLHRFPLVSDTLCRYFLRNPHNAFSGKNGEKQRKWGKNGEVFRVSISPPRTGSQTIVPVNSRMEKYSIGSRFFNSNGEISGKKMGN